MRTACRWGGVVVSGGCWKAVFMFFFNLHMSLPCSFTFSSLSLSLSLSFFFITHKHFPGGTKSSTTNGRVHPPDKGKFEQETAEINHQIKDLEAKLVS